MNMPNIINASSVPKRISFNYCLLFHIFKVEGKYLINIEGIFSFDSRLFSFFIDKSDSSDSLSLWMSLIYNLPYLHLNNSKWWRNHVIYYLFLKLIGVWKNINNIRNSFNRTKKKVGFLKLYIFSKTPELKRKGNVAVFLNIRHRVVLNKVE